MKSSSQLFPVRLISAEERGGFSEDIYLLKPGNSRDRQVEIAVTHLLPYRPANAVFRPPLILLHGNYQNRLFWYSHAGRGMAIALLSRFDVWLMDARGHGASPACTAGTGTAMTDVADFDVPAVNAFVREQTAALPLWMGYAEGALLLLNAMAMGSLGADTVAGVINLGNPWRDRRYLHTAIHAGWRRLFASRYQLCPRRGPETESVEWLRTLWREKTWFGRPARHLKTDLWTAVAASHIPLAWLADCTDLASIHRGLLRLQQAQRLQLLGGGSSWVKELMHSAAPVYDLTDSERAQHLAALVVSPGSGWSQSTGDHNHAIHPFGETPSAV